MTPFSKSEMHVTLVAVPYVYSKNLFRTVFDM